MYLVKTLCAVRQGVMKGDRNAVELFGKQDATPSAMTGDRNVVKGMSEIGCMTTSYDY